jgi:tetratricopeptide (TPR) repeat protein
MNDSTPDPVEHLTPPPLPSHLDELQRRIYARTRQALFSRWRWSWRRHVWGGVVAASFVAGLFVAANFREGPAPRDNEQTAERPDLLHPQPSKPAAVEEPDPLALEWQALEEPGQQADSYRQAGDLYLAAEDPEGAVRCYRKALDTASAAERTVTPEDSWLLAAIKHARQKEKDHDQTLD